MSRAWWQRIEAWLRALLPFSTALCAVFFDLAPLFGSRTGLTTSFLTLAVVFFWSLYRPELMGLGAVFVIGVLYDGAAGLPLGMSAVVLLLVRQVTASQRRFFVAKSFVVVWCCFVLLVPAAESLRWLLGCLWWGRLFDYNPMVLEAALTAALYPCVSYLLGQVHACIPSLSHAS